MKAIIAIVLLSVCLIPFASCQTASFCDPQTLLALFVNGYNATTQREQIWHYTNDHWDSVIVAVGQLGVGANDSWYSVQNLSPIMAACYAGSTADMDSHDWASFTWAFPNSTIMLTRDFYLPKATSWMRIIDTIHNNGTQAINTEWKYDTIYRSVTTYSELTDALWVTTLDGNFAFSVNAAMTSSLVLPYQASGFVPPSTLQTMYFNDIVIPAGESRSIMSIVGQYDTVDEALVNVQHIDTIPDEMLVNITDVMNIVNWVTCESSFEPPTERFSCSSAFSPIFTVSDFVSSVKVNDNAASVTNNQFSSRVINGSNVIAYEITTGRSFTCQYDFIAPEQDLNISLDLTGATPVPTATGGYGGYSFNVTVSSDGLTALVNVTDQQGCTASKEFDIPPPPVPVPSPQSSPVSGPESGTPLVNAPQNGPVSPGRAPSKLLSNASNLRLALVSAIISICFLLM